MQDFKFNLFIFVLPILYTFTMVIYFIIKSEAYCSYNTFGYIRKQRDLRSSLIWKYLCWIGNQSSTVRYHKYEFR